MPDRIQDWKICPILSIHPDTPDDMPCRKHNCGIWDTERECCSFNTKPLVVNKYEQAAVSRIKDRMKVEILVLLEQKTGWGRVELKTALFDLIDGLPDESSL